MEPAALTLSRWRSVSRLILSASCGGMLPGSGEGREADAERARRTEEGSRSTRGRDEGDADEAVEDVVLAGMAASISRLSSVSRRRACSASLSAVVRSINSLARLGVWAKRRTGDPHVLIYRK